MLARPKGLCAALIILAAFGGAAHAQSDYPTKPVRIILPFGPGGIADVTARLVAQKLSDRMGKNFYIENRPGAGGVIAAKAAMAAPPDGYTLLDTGNSAAISQVLFKTPPYNVLKDFTPVAMLAEFEVLLVTRAESKLDTVQKVVAYAKAHPGKLNFGAINVGSTQNLSAQLFRMTTGIDAVMVTYRTTPELIAAVASGDVDVAFDYFAPLRPMIHSQKIKVIATSGEAPDPELPGVPTVKASGYADYVVTSWNGLSGPAGVPNDIVARLNRETEAALKMPDVKKRMAEFGMHPVLSTPEQMRQRIEHDMAKWKTVIDAAGIPKQ
jgi:tripartite-type tricarboxylate transporter receptor subunit TctC